MARLRVGGFNTQSEACSFLPISDLPIRIPYPPWIVADSPLRGNLGYRIYTLARVYCNFFLNLTEAIHPRIFPEQWIVLNQLSLAPVPSQRDLLSPYAGGMAGLTRTLAIMERRGWIKRKRQAQDRRAISVRLTPKGRKVYNQILLVGGDSRRKMFAGISAEDHDKAHSVLDQLEENLLEAIALFKNRPRTSRSGL